MISAGKVCDVEYYVTGVGGGRESYYLDAVTGGEPAGRWGGAGAEAAGLAGEVEADDMRNLFHQYAAPDGRRLGRAPKTFRPLEERLADALKAEPDALPERRAEIRRQVEVEQRKTVLGWDLTHSVPKSVSVAHTALWRQELAAERTGDNDGAYRYREARLAVENAIQVANEAAMDFAESTMVARTGRHGAAGVAGKWIAAPAGIRASFFQHTSRALDPQLHTHNVWLNRVLCADGEWRAPDGAELLAQRRAVDAVASRVLAEELARDGFVMETRADGQARELLGVPDKVAELFSTRRGAVNGRTAEIVADLEQRYGRELTAREVDFVKRAATVRTRAAKTHEGESWEEMLERHNAALTAELGAGLAPLAGRLLDRYETRIEPVAGMFSPDAVVREAVAAVAEKDATWTRAELANEIERRLPPVLGLEAEDVPELLDRLVDHAVDLGEARQVAGRDRPVPASLAEDGVMFQRPTAVRYAAAATLADEENLTAAAVVRGRYAVDEQAVHAWLDEHAPSIGADQRAVVVGLASSDAAVSELIGPAGTGKSFAMGALAGAWAGLSAGGRVQGLTIAQSAAGVLRHDGVQVTANCAAWLGAQARVAEGRTGRNDLQYVIQPTDVVVVDEASMVDTATLTRIRRHVDAAGARLILAGDPEQLAAIGPGGAMELAAAGGADRFELGTVRRFNAEWEAEASLRLREGDASALDAYDKRGRLVDGGTVEQAITMAAERAAASILDGRDTLVVAGTNHEAAQTSAQIRDYLVAAGVVDGESPVVHLVDGGIASTGDQVIARENNYPLGMINQDRYRVAAADEHGGMVVVNAEGQRLPLPATYVEQHITSAYAATKHAAEGLSVDDAYTLHTGASDRSGVYVPATRGRELNVIIAVTVQRNADTGAVAEEQTTPYAVVKDALEGETAPAAASLVDEQDRERHAAGYEVLGRLEAYAEEAWLGRLRGMLDDLTERGALTVADRGRLAADPATKNLARLLRGEATAGRDAARVLEDAVTARSFGDAHSIAQVLDFRITHANREAEVVPDQAIENQPAAAWMPADVADELAALNDQLDDRRHVLAARQVEEPAEWAVKTLGPVPDDPAARAAWQEKAGRIAVYREAIGHDDDQLAVGHQPGQPYPERRRLWTAAWEASGRPGEQRPEETMTEGQLRARVRAGERARLWAPPQPDTAMRTAYLDEQEHRRAAVLAEQVDGDTDLTAKHDAEREHAAQVAARLESASSVRAEYLAEHGLDLIAERNARDELLRRNVPLGHETDRTLADVWLAGERASRAEDDRHRKIGEVDLHDPDRDAVVGDHVAAIEREAAVGVEPHAWMGGQVVLPERISDVELDAAMTAAHAAATQLADKRSLDVHAPDDGLHYDDYGYDVVDEDAAVLERS